MTQGVCQEDDLLFIKIFAHILIFDEKNAHCTQ